MCVLVLVLAFASSSARTCANATTSAGISLMCVLVRVPASLMRVLVQKILPVLIEVYQTVVLLRLGASSRHYRCSKLPVGTCALQRFIVVN